VVLPAALLAYSAAALAVKHWWISGLAAPVVAALLWRRHPRARFSTYILCSGMAWRGVMVGSWGLLAFAAAALAAMQTPAARAAWPRVRPRSRLGRR
jgi:hypothetical protein